MVIGHHPHPPSWRSSSQQHSHNHSSAASSQATSGLNSPTHFHHTASFCIPSSLLASYLLLCLYGCSTFHFVIQFPIDSVFSRAIHLPPSPLNPLDSSPSTPSSFIAIKRVLKRCVEGSIVHPFQHFSQQH